MLGVTQDVVQLRHAQASKEGTRKKVAPAGPWHQPTLYTLSPPPPCAIVKHIAAGPCNARMHSVHACMHGWGVHPPYTDLAAPSAACHAWLTRVVLPEPRNPVMTCSAGCSAMQAPRAAKGKRACPFAGVCTHSAPKPRLTHPQHRTRHATADTADGLHGNASVPTITHAQAEL